MSERDDTTKKSAPPDPTTSLAKVGSAVSATPTPGLSWPSTVVLATVVAVIVYFVVRMIR